MLSVKAYWSVNKQFINISQFRFILQIYSSEWVLFTVLLFKKKKKPYGPFLWMELNCLKATEPLRGGTLLFTIKLPSILSFPKKLLPTIFQFSCFDSKFCDVLCDLVPFIQFQNVKNTYEGVLLLVKMQKHSSVGVFHVFKIVLMTPNRAKIHYLSRLSVGS